MKQKQEFMKEVNKHNFLSRLDNFANKVDISSTLIIESNINFIPKITIAIPTYKRAHFLKEAVDSAINQISFDDYEIIVIDNDSNRNCESERLINSYNNSRLSYYKNTENIGMYGNWNRCITLSKGDYITILNDDDTLEENYLSQINYFLQRMGDVHALLVRFNYIDSNSIITSNANKYNKKIKRVLLLELFWGNINPGSLGILFSKEQMLKVGGFDESYFPSSDYEFLVNYIANFDNVFTINQYLANYRLAVNESQKLITLNNFIKKDNSIRKSFINFFPKIKILIESAIPVIKYNQYKTLSNTSLDFYQDNINKISSLYKTITFKNRLSLKIIYLILMFFKKFKFMIK